MITKERLFLQEIGVETNTAKRNVIDKYDLNPGNNIDLICEKIYECDDQKGCVYVEAGVFRGNTLFTVAEFTMLYKNNFKLIGMDTFEGFPMIKIHPYDHPQKFIELFENSEITKQHYELAAKRTKGFKNTDHLLNEYFLDVQEVYNISDDYSNTQLIKGDFKETLDLITEEIDVLFLDCDLYESYMLCLEKLYCKVKKGGAIIFDEYYSLKYPGARIAVNKYFERKNGTFEIFKTNEGFERWCFVVN